MAREMKEAEIWLYPTNFDEISCVAAMEAMAAGCKVVSTRHAALKETLEGYPGLVDIGEREAPNALVCAVAKDDHDPATCAEFARKFDLDKLADKWAEEVFPRECESRSCAA